MGFHWSAGFSYYVHVPHPLGPQNCLAFPRFIGHDTGIWYYRPYFVGSLYQCWHGFRNTAGCRHSASFFKLWWFGDGLFDDSDRIINEYQRAQLYFEKLKIKPVAIGSNPVALKISNKITTRRMVCGKKRKNLKKFKPSWVKVQSLSCLLYTSDAAD